MLKLLIRWFIPDREHVADPRVRSAYGVLCGAYGIFLNLLLFAGKLYAGTLAGSVAVMADAFNNLSDAGSSAVTLFGFALSSKRPDPEHPYGHGRIEYLAGLFISTVIMLVGADLIRVSANRIFHPQSGDAGLLQIIVLAAAILLKIYMFFYNKDIGRKIGSGAMEAAATDSLSDAAASFVTLISILIFHLTGLNIDGWAGLAVAMFILYSGFRSARETVSPLLGRTPDPVLTDQIIQAVTSHPEILGIHDLIIHDYGPGRIYVSLHAEVDGHGDFFALHDVVDTAERELRDSFGCLATIHMDPVETNDPSLDAVRTSVLQLLRGCVGEYISLHDFRLVPGPTHSKLIFDVTVPMADRRTDRQLEELIRNAIRERYDNYDISITIDREFSQSHT